MDLASPHAFERWPIVSTVRSLFTMFVCLLIVNTAAADQPAVVLPQVVHRSHPVVTAGANLDRNQVLQLQHLRKVQQLQFQRQLQAQLNQRQSVPAFAVPNGAFIDPRFLNTGFRGSRFGGPTGIQVPAVIHGVRIQASPFK